MRGHALSKLLLFKVVDAAHDDEHRDADDDGVAIGAS